MDRREEDLLLRPRNGSMAVDQAVPADAAAPAMLLPRHARASSTAATHALPSTRRRWLPRLLLLAGALYASLLLVWSATRLQSGDSSTMETASPTAPGTMDLTAILKAANHPETPQEKARAKKLAQLELQRQREAAEEGEETQESAQEEEETQTLRQKAVDLPMAASQQAQALREAREEVEVQLQMQRLQEAGSESEETEDERQQRLQRERDVAEAEEQALSVLLLPKGETQTRQFKCIGWRATGGCSPHGPREPQNDLSCSRVVPVGRSGYCEVEDTDSGERFRVMRRYCDSLKYDAVFRCSDAPDFVNFALKAGDAAGKALEPGFALPNVASDGPQDGQQDGIVMVVYPKLVASAYATIRALREVHDCGLPIEIWYRLSEMNFVAEALEPLRDLAKATEGSGEIHFREINDWHATGFGSKVFAIYNSRFERVLFLDSDNVPVKDPSYLFESKEFQDTGAVFWPDFWHPRRTIFNIQPQSLLWQLVDLPFVDMFEQESGQLLVDRRKHAQSLELVNYYSFHRPSHFDKMKLVHGDKDLFRLAWLKLEMPFHMVQTPPAIAGKVINESFCGLTMVQHDTEGEVLFLHRNSHKLTGELLREEVDARARGAARSKRKTELKNQAKAEGRSMPTLDELNAIILSEETPAPTLEPPEADGYPDTAVWTHLLSFQNSSRREDYYIQTYNADPEFPKSQNCYGQRYLNDTRLFQAQEVADLVFAGLESRLRQFAAEAVQIHEAKLAAPE